MNSNYVYVRIVYVRIGKGRKRHIMHRAQFEAGCEYAICGMGGKLFQDDSDTAVCAACLKKLSRIRG